MVSLKILELNRFMVKLLKNDTFDSFLLREGFMRTYMEYRFQGKLFPEYFDAAEQEQRKGEDGEKASSYVTWGEVRPMVFELVKGKRTPLAFQFILVLSEKETKKLVEEQGLNIQPEEEATGYLQIRFEHGECHIVTGTSRNTFTMDRSFEEAWDEQVKRILVQLEIPTEQ